MSIWAHLVGGLEHFLFSIIYGIILPIDSYFSRWLKSPTSHWFWVIFTFWTIFKHLNPGLFGSLSHAWEMVMFSPAGAQWREAGLGCCKPEQMWMNIFISSSTHFTNYVGLVKLHFDMLVGEMKIHPIETILNLQEKTQTHVEQQIPGDWQNQINIPLHKP